MASGDIQSEGRVWVIQQSPANLAAVSALAATRNAGGDSWIRQANLQSLTCWAMGLQDGGSDDCDFFLATLSTSPVQQKANSFVSGDTVRRTLGHAGGFRSCELQHKLESRYKIQKLRKLLRILDGITKRESISILDRASISILHQSRP